MFERANELRAKGPSVLDAIADPNGTAFLLAHLPPRGAHLHAADALELNALSEAACIDLLIGLEAQRSWLDARQQQLLAVMHTRQRRSVDAGEESARDWLREDVACALKLAPRTAQNRIDVAAELADRLPDTLAALATGQISYRHVLALTDATAALDDELACAVEARVLGRAARQTPYEFRASVRRAVMALDTAAAEEKHLLALEERRVTTHPAEDGMVDLHARLSAPGVAVVMEAIDTLASVTSAGDGRTIDQRRADALVCLGSAVINDPSAPRAQGLRPHIQVSVAASTLLGLDDLPAELDGYGPISAEQARDLAADPSGTWRRILVDPASGTVLDYGTTRYRPPPSLTRHIMARDRECVFPHCRRRAHRCDVDHLQRWSDGGSTRAANRARSAHGIMPRRTSTAGRSFATTEPVSTCGPARRDTTTPRPFRRI